MTPPATLRARLAAASAATATAALLVATPLSAVGRPAAAPGPALRAATAAPAARDLSHHLAGDLGPAAGQPRAWAEHALRTHAAALGLGAASFHWLAPRRSVVGTVVRGVQQRGGVPVEGTDVLVRALHGRVVQLDLDVTRLAGSPAAHPVGAVAARASALSALSITSLLAPTHVARVLSASGGHLVDTYQVSVLGAVPARAARVDVDAATGLVRDVADVAQRDASPRAGGSATARARVFDPNPVVTSHDTGLRSPFETGTGVDLPLDSPALTRQLRTRTMKDLDASQLRAGLLSGRWVRVLGTAGYLAPLGGPLHFSRSDPRFVGLMAYTHIDRYQRWLRSLGLTHVDDEQQDVVPTLAEGYDNSMYMPGEDVIVYGGGGVPDAEDAEVVLHEYGHAMQDAQVPGYGANEQGGAMGEGFGDFNSANYYALTSGGFGDLCIAEWDSTTYSTSHPPCLRRLDSTKRYPKDVDGEVHDDGEMWSAFLWRVRSHLGTTTHARSVNAIRLVLAMHETLTPQARYANAVAGLRTAARAMHHRSWVRVIDREARRTGYPLNP